MKDGVLARREEGSHRAWAQTKNERGFLSGSRGGALDFASNQVERLRGFAVALDGRRF